MTKKDFILLANALYAAKPYADQPRDLATWAGICARVAMALEETNPRFNYDAFLKACAGE